MIEVKTITIVEVTRDPKYFSDQLAISEKIREKLNETLMKKLEPIILEASQNRKTLTLYPIKIMHRVDCFSASIVDTVVQDYRLER